MNLYAYGGNDPLNRVDPLGLASDQVQNSAQRQNLTMCDACPSAGFVPGQQYAQDITRQNLTVPGNPTVDRTTNLLLSVLQATVESLGSGSGALFGVQAHVEFANRVKQLDLPGIGFEGVEQSFSFGDTVRYGLAGSVRTDVVLRDKFGTPLAVYDLKTGNAVLTPSRVQDIREAVGVPNVRVIELRYTTLTVVPR